MGVFFRSVGNILRGIIPRSFSFFTISKENDHRSMQQLALSGSRIVALRTTVALHMWFEYLQAAHKLAHQRALVLLRWRRRSQSQLHAGEVRFPKIVTVPMMVWAPWRSGGSVSPQCGCDPDKLAALQYITCPVHFCNSHRYRLSTVSSNY